MSSYSSSDPSSLLDFDWWSTTSIVEQQQQEQETAMAASSLHDHADATISERLRLLKQAGDYQRPDYSVLSVTVMTLGLIIMVEFVKHKMDHMAHGRRYFTAVLQTFYAECTCVTFVSNVMNISSHPSLSLSLSLSTINDSLSLSLSRTPSLLLSSPPLIRCFLNKILHYITINNKQQ
jgi:hypothetical protein